MSPDRLRFLAAHDTDPFVRWDSGQQFATGSLLAMVAARQRGEQPATEPALLDAMEATLAAADADPAFAAEALSLPSETFLGDQMSIVDVDAIHAVRDAARKAIGQLFADMLLATYDRLAESGPYRIDGPSIGRRALRNICLAYLAASGDPAGVRLAKAQFDANQNMTDVLSALAVLASVDCPERLEALETFHRAWRGDALALDKWFAIQAVSPLPTTLDSVRGLAAHQDFDLRNPNRMRALIGSFTGGNQVRFHDASGAGYQFLTDTIMQLDPINGQVAARMVSPLGQWRRFDVNRQTLMKQELERILALPALSTNVFEMASRSLA
jgi:aminopeptidase N